MRLVEFFSLFEGYKEAIADFSKAADVAEVGSVIDQYKSLVNRNQVSGQERNIDYWRKQGWDAFNAFVKDRVGKPSATQIKRSKLQGEAIKLVDDDEWLIVVPLDKPASCHYGRGSDWCTTKPNQSYFEEYFYVNGVTLIYCIRKADNAMWAVAAHEDVDKIEIFDQADNSISVRRFESDTEWNLEFMLGMAMFPDVQRKISARKEWFYDIRGQIDNFLRDKTSGNERSERVEDQLRMTNDTEYGLRYVRKVGGSGPVEFPEDICILAINGGPSCIGYIKNPSASVQMAALDKSITSIEFISNPAEEVQLRVATQAPHLIHAIENPTEAAQMKVVDYDPEFIKYIRNPSMATMKRVIDNSTTNITYINNPPVEIQLYAVKKSIYTIQSISNPDEEVQMHVALDSPFDLGLFEPTERVQLAAVDKSPWSIQAIKNPYPSVVKLAAERGVTVNRKTEHE